MHVKKCVHWSYSTDIYLFIYTVQARNQEVFRAWGVLLELGHLHKDSPTTQERKAAQGKNHRIFCLELKIAF